MNVYFQFSIFQAQWKMKLTVCTRIVVVVRSALGNVYVRLGPTWSDLVIRVTGQVEVNITYMSNVI